MIDIASVKSPSKRGSLHCLLIVDEATDHCCSRFLQKKSEVAEKIIALIQDLSNQGRQLHYSCCDNAGENLKFQEEAT